MVANKFRNPYNFVPFGDADKIGTLSNGDLLGQGEPKSHARYHEDHWSGRIGIRIEVATPLLIPDTSREQRHNGHATLPLLKDKSGKPLLPPTSLKGALRTAYEAITNSRLGVFQQYGKKKKGTVAPQDMVPEKLRPATDFGELSPADRVFGWVRQRGKKRPDAWRGQLRIRTIRCEGLKTGNEPVDADGEVVKPFAPPLPLAILSAPKVAQARFYVGTADGKPLGNEELPGLGVYKAAGISKDAYFEKVSPPASPLRQLRGRKVYPHHSFSLTRKNYWDGDSALKDAQCMPPKPKVKDKTVWICWQSPHREYVRRKGWIKEGSRNNQQVKNHDKNTDSQNRSITEWIVPGTVFTAEIDVMNLNKAELGALLWLLDLPHFANQGANTARNCDYFHRIGAGKPLGFGSVKITLASLDLKNGQARKNEFKSLMPQGEAALKTGEVKL